jgi:2,3-bisphosphoglycerate-dependent phosphoglycerate mutase
MTWRRSYRAVPPNGESLEMTQKRVVPLLQEHDNA